MVDVAPTSSLQCVQWSTSRTNPRCQRFLPITMRDHYPEDKSDHTSPPKDTVKTTPSPPKSPPSTTTSSPKKTSPPSSPSPVVPASQQVNYALETSSVITTAKEFDMVAITGALAFMLASALAYAVAVTWDATITQWFTDIHLPPSSASTIKSLMITALAIVLTILINRYLANKMLHMGRLGHL